MMIGLEQVTTWLKKMGVVFDEQKGYLSDLDSAIGDGDHGVNMARGFAAVVQSLETAPPADIAGAFKQVSATLIKSVGGASGPLYGTFFLRASLALAGKAEVGLSEWIAALEKGVQGIQQLGKAQAGDKTMLEAWLPALEALKTAESSGKDLKAALTAAADAAEAGMTATIPLVAKKGRASYLGERSAGHQDPGATSTAFLLRNLAEL